MFCEVFLLDLPYHIDRVFDYSCADGISAGDIVKVPFGRSNALRYGLVYRTKDSSESENTKPVHSKADSRFALCPKMLGLCLFLKEHTLCTVGEAVRCILPPGALSDKLNLSYKRTVSLIIDEERVHKLLDVGTKGALRSAGQREILRYLLSSPTADASLLGKLPSASSANLKALASRGYIRIDECENIRNPYARYSQKRDMTPIVLSPAQTKAYGEIEELMNKKAPACALLHGVTGSGKTKVIIKAIDKCLEDGKRSIMLVPEIALTPQTLGIFCARYGDNVAVIHSSLSSGERMDAWLRIKRGDVSLVIGTRSAIFAPLSDVGLIVIDEEHEHTYKSESDPKYHAKDVASFLCGQHNATLILASATPSLESYYKAKCGTYKLVQLTERYGGVSLPDAVIVDMREELRLGNVTPISDRLLKELKRVSDNEEQAILFLNRRGYNSQVSCKSCGDVIGCPRCSVSLTYHSAGNKMLCHMCGYSIPVPKKCPSCSSDKLSFLGYGTQKVEAELGRFMPEATVMRMDADTTGAKLAYDRMLEEFRGGSADILLGTQMVAKGHDFPKVTLSGIVLADTSLFVDDFRAAERTFSLLAQVIGRAGRALDGGIAVIQTYCPKNEVINLACSQDYEKFYQGEIAIRRELSYPPFCDIVSITVTAGSEADAMRDSRAILDIMLPIIECELSDLPFSVFGPFEASTYKLNDKYRMRIIIKCKNCKGVREMLSRVLSTFNSGSYSSTASVDINPLTV